MITTPFLYNRTAQMIDNMSADTEKIKTCIRSWRSLNGIYKTLNAREIYIAFQTEVEGKNRDNIVNALMARYYKLVKKLELDSSKYFTSLKNKSEKESSDRKLHYKADNFKALQES